MSENRRGDIFDPHCTADNSQRSWLSMPHHRNKVSGKGWGKSSSPFPSLPCLAFPIPDPPSYLSFPFTFPYSPFCFLSSCLPHFYSHSRQGTEKRISSSNVFQYENPASGVHSEWVSEWVSSVLRHHQHSIGYTGDGFYRSKDPTNSIKVLKEDLQKTKKTRKLCYRKEMTARCVL